MIHQATRTQSSTGDLRQRNLTPTLYLAAALLVACSTDGAKQAETDPANIGTKADPVNGYGVSADSTNGKSPEANAVVDFGNCSGILLTPQMVLTASHCIWGGTSNNSCMTTPAITKFFADPENPTGPMKPANRVGIGGGPYGTIGDNQTYVFVRLANGQQQMGVTFDTRFNTCVSAPADAGLDVALVYLDQPIVEATIGTKVAIPRLAKLSGNFPEAPPYGRTWGASGFGSSSQRRFKLFPGALDYKDESSGGRVFRLQDADWILDPGDSGGPLFSVNNDGTRLPLGAAIYVSGNPGDDDASSAWADLYHGDVRTWLRDKMKEGARHSATWLAKHGKTSESWWGELDYSGPCDHVHDGDCDGWWGQNPDATHPVHDNCPALANPLQEGDGDRGDACLVCPLGPIDDPDGDTVCNTCPASDPDCTTKDNCPNVWNRGQENCNKEYEKASNARGVPVAILGDACDPTPCPRAVPVTTLGPPAPAAACKPQPFRIVKDQFEITPVASHKKDVTVVGTPPPAYSVGNVATIARFCQISQKAQVTCGDPNTMVDAQLFTSQNSESVTEPSPNRPWNRMRLRPIPDGAWNERNNNTGITVLYDGNATQRVLWDYKADNAHWHRDGLDVVGSRSPEARCDKTFFDGDAGAGDAGDGGDAGASLLGTCLNGRIWLHANSTTGNSFNKFAGATEVGTHGDDLANFSFEVAPDEAFLRDGCFMHKFRACMLSPLGCVSNRFGMNANFCPPCGGNSFLATIARDRIQPPLLPTTELANPLQALIWEGALFPAQDLGIALNVQQALTNRRFFWALEAAPAQGGEIAAIALADAMNPMGAKLRIGASSTTAMIIEPASFGSAMTSLSSISEDGSLSEPPPSETPAADVTAAALDPNSFVLYSRARQMIFAVGMLTDVNFGSHIQRMRTVYTQPVSGSSGSALRLAADITTGRVLASTIVPTPGAAPWMLWVVTKEAAGSVFLKAYTMNQTDLVLRSSAQLPSVAGVYPDYVLSSAWDAPSTALLTLSDRTTGSWGVLEVASTCPFSTCAPTFRGVYKRSDFGGQGYLFQGIYTEGETLVAVTVQPELQPRSDRRERHTLGVKPLVPVASLNSWKD